MHQIFLGLVSAMLAVGTPQMPTNSAPPAPKDADELASTNSPGELELEKIMTEDDAAMDDIDKWIQENNKFAKEGAGESKDELNNRILARLQIVRTNYQNFLTRYPTNADAYIAYGSFLNDLGDEEGAFTQYDKSRQLNPNNPAVWNDLGNYYGEYSPITNAFTCYTKAIELNPKESVYYQNFATTVYLYRKDAKEFYHINEAQVFDKALALYQKAVALDPDNFELNEFYSESYYGIKPLRTNEALVAWTNTLKVARTEYEREGINVHLARTKIAAGMFAEAQGHLDLVTNADYADLKRRLEITMTNRMNGTRSSFDPIPTNGPAADANFSATAPNAATSATNGVSSHPKPDAP
jgi:tetratricopeptide (TPR) repeat protein